MGTGEDEVQVKTLRNRKPRGEKNWQPRLVKAWEVVGEVKEDEVGGRQEFKFYCKCMGGYSKIFKNVMCL